MHSPTGRPRRENQSPYLPYTSRETEDRILPTGKKKEKPPARPIKVLQAVPCVLLTLSDKANAIQKLPISLKKVVPATRETLPTNNTEHYGKRGQPSIPRFPVPAQRRRATLLSIPFAALQKPLKRNYTSLKTLREQPRCPYFLKKSANLPQFSPKKTADSYFLLIFAAD